jgi:hypothetical protein
VAIPSAFLICLIPLPRLLPNLCRHRRRRHRREDKRQVQVLSEKYAEETGGISDLPVVSFSKRPEHFSWLYLKRFSLHVSKTRVSIALLCSPLLTSAHLCSPLLNLPSPPSHEISQLAHNKPLYLLSRLPGYEVGSTHAMSLRNYASQVRTAKSGSRFSHSRGRLR